MRALVPIAAGQDPGLQGEQLAALGMPIETIAQSFGLTIAELRRQYNDALDHGSARRRAEIVGLMFTAARAGNTSATLWLWRRMEGAAAERLASSPRSAPRLVVDNA